MTLFTKAYKANSDERSLTLLEALKLSVNAFTSHRIYMMKTNANHLNMIPHTRPIEVS